MELIKFLKEKDPVIQLKDWTESYNIHTIEQCVSHCPKGEWLLWFAYKLRLCDKKIMLCNGLCANTVKEIMYPRAIECLNIAINYGYGNVTNTEIEYAEKQYKEWGEYITSISPVYANVFYNADSAKRASVIDANYAGFGALSIGGSPAHYAAESTYYLEYSKSLSHSLSRDAQRQNELQTADICREILGQNIIDTFNKPNLCQNTILI